MITGQIVRDTAVVIAILRQEVPHTGQTMCLGVVLKKRFDLRLPLAPEDGTGAVQHHRS